MGKINRAKKTVIETAQPLERRNYQCSDLSSHHLFYAENIDEATNIAKRLLGIKKNEPFNLKPYN